MSDASGAPRRAAGSAQGGPAGGSAPGPVLPAAGGAVTSPAAPSTPALMPGSTAASTTGRAGRPAAGPVVEPVAETAAVSGAGATGPGVEQGADPARSGNPAAAVEVDEPPGPGPLGVERPGTGNPAVDAALRRLADLDGLPTEDHAAVYEEIHGSLRDVLASLDHRQGPPPPEHPSRPSAAHSIPQPPVRNRS